jgi:DNA-binding XRE family transcriptional regulator
MENQIYERDYRQAKERKRQVLHSTDFDVIGELKAAGFFQKLNERLNQIPKVIVPEDKVNYDYLLEQCDAFAKRHGGRLRGIVDFEQYESHINLYVPFFEIDFPEDRRFIFDVLTRSTYFSFMPDKTGWTRLHIFINYFSEAISQDAKADIINQLCEEMGDEFQNNLVQNNRFGTAVDKLYDIGIYDEAPEYEGSTQTMDGMTIMAKKIRAYRESLGKSQYELASDWSLPTNELVALESGKADPFLSTIVKVAGFMGLSASELLNERR